MHRAIIYNVIRNVHNQSRGIVMWLSFQVNTLLDKSSVWATYKEQRHDLFLSDNQVSGYLTGKMVLCQGTALLIQIFTPTL